MAERRSLSKSISISEKVNNLSLFGRLLYTWMIPHADDFGRLPGSPVKVRALVVPMGDETVKDVESALSDMNKVGLINWYEIDNEKYIQITNFDEHQTGIHKRTKSKFPEPPIDSENFPEIPPEGKGREGKRNEGKGTESGAPDPQNRETLKTTIFELTQQCGLKKVNMMTLDEIYAFIGVVDFDVILAAIKKSQDKHVNYAINTLTGWCEEGKTTKESLNPVAEFKGRQKPKQRDPELISRDYEIALNKFVSAGGNPYEFKYDPTGTDSS